jgi:hypothetical protein
METHTGCMRAPPSGPQAFHDAVAAPDSCAEIRSDSCNESPNANSNSYAYHPFSRKRRHP